MRLHWSDGNMHALQEHLARLEDDDEIGQEVGDACNRVQDSGWRCSGEMFLHPVEGVVCDTCHESAERDL